MAMPILRNMDLLRERNHVGELGVRLAQRDDAIGVGRVRSVGGGTGKNQRRGRTAKRAERRAGMNTRPYNGVAGDDYEDRAGDQVWGFDDVGAILYGWEWVVFLCGG
jgi:hypothetical protein